MDLMIYTKIAERLASELPKDAANLSAAMEMLRASIDDSLKDMDSLSGMDLHERKYDEAQEKLAYSKEIVGVLSQLDRWIGILDDAIRRENARSETCGSGNEARAGQWESNVPHVPQIDPNEAHFLYEDFTYKRPCRFSLEGQSFDVGSWQDVLVTTCAVLFQKDPVLMQKLVALRLIRGKKNVYLLHSPVSGRTKPIPGTQYHVWINLSADKITNVITRLLNEFSVNVSDMEIFLEADCSMENMQMSFC